MELLTNKFTIRLKESDVKLLEELAKQQNTTKANLGRNLILNELKNKGMK